jgi:hypothetical protein
MWVVEDVPELIYCLAISPRLFGHHAHDRSQRKREKCVAASPQRRPYRLGTDIRPRVHDLLGEFAKALLLTSAGISLHDQIFPLDIA